MNITCRTLLISSFCLFSIQLGFSQPHNSSRPQINAELFYQYGIDFHKTGDLERAIDYYTESILRDPLHVNAVYNRGLAYFKQEKYNKALYDFNSLININPDDIQAYEQRARVKFMLNDHEGAYLDYSYAIEQSATSILFVNRGMASSMLKNYSKALKDYDEALSKNPEDAEAYVNKGDVYFATEDYPTAIQYYTQALNLTPGDERTYNNRANAYIKIHQFDLALQDYNKALQIKENSYTHVNRGFYWLDQLESEAALSDFLIATKMDYRNAGAYFGVSSVKLESGDLLTALENINKAIDLDPKNELYFNLRGVTYHELAFYEDAIHDFSLALKNNPRYSEALCNRALSYYLTGNISDAFADLENALQINPNDTIAFNRLELLQNQSNSMSGVVPAKSFDLSASLYAMSEEDNTGYDESIFEEESDYKSVDLLTSGYATPNPNNFIPKGVPVRKLPVNAITEAEQDTYLVLSLNLESESSVSNDAVDKEKETFLRAMSHLEAEQFQKAIEGFEQVILLNPKSVKAYNGRGVAFYKIASFEKALKDFTTAIKLNPSFSEAFYNRGNLYFDQNIINYAEADFSKVIQLSPDFSNAFFMRGICFEKQKKYSKALQDFDKAVELNPGNAKALNNRGTLLFISGNVFESIDDYTRAIEVSPLESALYANRAKAREKILLFDKALEDCEMAIRYNPNDPEMHYLKGLILYKTNRFSKAILAFNEAIVLSSKPNPIFYYRRALCFHVNNQLEKAVEDYDQTIAIGSNNPEVYYNRALAKKDLKDDIGACRDYTKAKQLGLNTADKTLCKN